MNSSSEHGVLNELFCLFGFRVDRVIPRMPIEGLSVGGFQTERSISAESFIERERVCELRKQARWVESVVFVCLTSEWIGASCECQLKVDRWNFRA